MGFKEYAIHIAVRHHFLESLMAEIKTPEMADLLEEVIALRHAKGEQVGREHTILTLYSHFRQ